MADEDGIKGEIADREADLAGLRRMAPGIADAMAGAPVLGVLGPVFKRRINRECRERFRVLTKLVGGAEPEDLSDEDFGRLGQAIEDEPFCFEAFTQLFVDDERAKAWLLSGLFDSFVRQRVPVDDRRSLLQVFRALSERGLLFASHIRETSLLLETYLSGDGEQDTHIAQLMAKAEKKRQAIVDDVVTDCWQAAARLDPLCVSTLVSHGYMANESRGLEQCAMPTVRLAALGRVLEWIIDEAGRGDLEIARMKPVPEMLEQRLNGPGRAQVMTG